MDIMIDRHQGPPPGESGIIALMRADGLSLNGWGSAPGDTYGWHEHSYEWCSTAYAAGSSSTPTAATLIPETAWCYLRTPCTQPPSAQKACVSLRRPATARPPPAMRGALGVDVVGSALAGEDDRG